MNKSLLLASCALVALSGAAIAADLPARTKAAAPTPAFASNWNGVYVGLNGGFGWGTEKDQYITPVIGNFNTTGGLFGVQIGYNRHLSPNMVVGLEADYSWANLSKKVTETASTNFVANGTTYNLTATGSIETKQNSLGTVRARLGFVGGNALFYGTAGLAYAQNTIKLSASLSDGATTVAAADSFSKTYMGWVIGAGTEYQFNRNISAKLEYLYADLGNQTYFKGTAFADKVSVTNNVVRAGLNYKF